ncbi:MAG: chondroitinase [Bacteroidales bacterium]|nr:chondroitinase [Bacteroidales bacterium]
MKLFPVLIAAMLCLSAGAVPTDDPRLLTFEDETSLSGIDPGKGFVRLTDRHFREGAHSLEWTFRRAEPLSLRCDIPFEPMDPTGEDTYLSTFIVWIRNDAPFSAPLTFEFRKAGRTCCSFRMGMDFHGWRAVWVCFERDMEGTPETGMDEIRLLPPAGEGSICLDHIVTATKVDSRFQSPDAQAPFVNAGTSNHWLLIWKNSLMQPDLPLEPMDEAVVREMHLVEERFAGMLHEKRPVRSERLEKIRKRFAFYRIRRAEDGSVTGRPVFMVRHAEAYERMMPDWDKDYFRKRGLDFLSYFDLMLGVATAWNDSDDESLKSELRGMFLDLYDHITELGVAAGSSWGYCHHYGYDIRKIYPAYFLMKDVLRESGRLEEAAATLRWYAITNEVLAEPQEDGIVIDSFNTHLEGRLASILLMEDSPEKVRYLRSFSRWIDRGCRPAPGLKGSFKTDGTCFHHMNNYPAYAIGGLDGVTKAMMMLGGTRFRVPAAAHDSVRKCLLTLRFCCNLTQWPLSMSGRHPNGTGHLSSLQYGLMALAGTPDGSAPVDTAMARAFLRLTPSLPKPSKFEKQLAARFRKAGILPEDDPQGNLALGYGCLSAHRRGRSLAVVRGHSRYLWATEQYLGANFYGRYLGYGGLEILTAPDGVPVSLESSGWMEAGFDWNRLPGVTSVHLPWDRLRARVLNVDSFSGFEEMLISDEAFAGGLSSGGRDGNFGMKVHGHDKYDGSLRARKSYHFIDGLIVALGSGIEDGDELCRTETTVFQLACPGTSEKKHWEGYGAGDCGFVDPAGTGYYVAPFSREDAVFRKSFPQEGVWERKEGLSYGDWVSLVLDHGTAPSEAGYEYAVLLETDRESMASFARKPAYKVLRRDNGAHVVSVPAKGITSYVCFEPQNLLKPGPVCAVDTSALVMTKAAKGSLLLTVAQPDLALYRGDADEVFDAEGKRIERSIYSRTWTGNESGEIPVTVTLKGRWEVAEELPSWAEVTPAGQCTAIRFTCREGRSYDLRLRKK